MSQFTIYPRISDVRSFSLAYVFSKKDKIRKPHDVLDDDDAEC